MNTYKTILNTIVEPIAEHDEAYLRGWVSYLKGEGGEGWAVGEMLERAMRYISMTLALAGEASVASQYPEPAPPSFNGFSEEDKGGTATCG